MNHWNTVQIERNGKRYAGKYRVEGGIITVTYDGEGGGDKSANVGSSEPAPLATRLFTELVSELPNERGPLGGSHS
jgi:hypothetical protein